MNTLKELQEASDYIRVRLNIGRSTDRPRIGIVLGSGFGSFIRRMENIVFVPYSDIPHLLPKDADHHQGQMLLGDIEGQKVLALHGRLHFYEGYPMSTVVFPIRLMALLGVESVILTNSCGGLRRGMQVGDFFIIEDHVNLMGQNPLMGPNMKELGPRFPDMKEPYDPKIMKFLEDHFKKENIPFHKGIYAGVSGPTYETAAEVKYLQAIGCSAVGMSSVPEAIAANHMGLRVAAFSCIVNMGSGLKDAFAEFEDFETIARRVDHQVTVLLERLIMHISIS